MAPNTKNPALTSATRSVWDLDPTHSSIEFTIKHLMFSKVRGRFRTFTTTVEVDEADPTRSAVVANIEVASIDTGTVDRDDHLRSADFFDAETHPQITFRSSRIEALGAEAAEVTGDLTIRGVTQPVTIKVERDGIGQDPWGNTRASYSGQATLERDVFGLRWNQALETGGVLVGNTVKVQIQLQLVRRADQ